MMWKKNWHYIFGHIAQPSMRYSVIRIEVNTTNIKMSFQNILFSPLLLLTQSMTWMF